jgi:hypothetical protein
MGSQIFHVGSFQGQKSWGPKRESVGRDFFALKIIFFIEKSWNLSRNTIKNI